MICRRCGAVLATPRNQRLCNGCIIAVAANALLVNAGEYEVLTLMARYKAMAEYQRLIGEFLLRASRWMPGLSEKEWMNAADEALRRATEAYENGTHPIDYSGILDGFFELDDRRRVS